MKDKKLKADYWKEGRYVIVDENTGEIVDDAQGYGYKDKQRAVKAMWWKFNGGKEKKNNDKISFNRWIKIDNNKEIFNKLSNIIEDNLKEIARKEITINEITKEIENEYSIIIPKFVTNNL